MHFNFTVSRKSCLAIGSVVAAGAVGYLLWRNVIKPRFWNSREGGVLVEDELAERLRHSGTVVDARSPDARRVYRDFEKWKLHSEFSGFIAEELLHIHEETSAYGIVYKGRFGPRKSSVAVKEFLFKTRNLDYNRKYFQEMQLTFNLRHKFIIKTLAISSKCIANSVYIMQECMQGDITDLLETACVRALNERSAMFVLAGCVCALKYLHSHNIIHCDIKGKNILVDERGYVKLGDFGLSIVLDDTGDHQSTGMRGTYGYTAPEIMRCYRFDTQVDIWSLGAAIYELLHTRTPFGYSDRIASEWEYDYLPFRAAMTEPCEELLRKMLRYYPEERPTIRQIYNSRYMRNKIQRVWAKSFPSPLLEILPEPPQQSCEW